jgi:hypothetical protein
MRHAGWIAILVVIMFVGGVFWYATSGQAYLARVALTNDAAIAAGTTWVDSDAGLYGGPVTAVAVLPSQPDIVYAGTKEDETYVSADGGSLWSRLGSAVTGHYVAGLSLIHISEPTRPY